ncbi:hypothetical protein PK35_03255 [Tamlana nanhaiensis]|uniref:Uncharacterized protein n=1 Tax=Neotamlana nanhaiensis TaxID=1382798 RepID=A0A0D7W3U5_9FLAO|nr:DUF6660 family protein [Tamlana nanhaiensis]KJD33785.1 hypothetical protein PK35_03255 [Tamlana nanhaiensis]
MKFLAFILSIYIFTLNLMPCEDSVVADNEVKTEISQKHDSDHNHQDNDLCSPFCQCHCCHIHVTQCQATEYNLVKPIISTQVGHHFEGLVKNFNASILQPPRA